MITQRYFSSGREKNYCTKYYLIDTTDLPGPQCLGQVRKVIFAISVEESDITEHGSDSVHIVICDWKQVTVDSSHDDDVIQ